ncbi:methyltransferase domain-containing protein [Tepidibacter formicigenes]|uniref:Methyltransferase domain-containing protein n=1 Tax=Tepidibacter formicigenes DSM 15518 TaxID=1123349 RepID=A0A1M6MM05_9FIRM|nr:methyltransferase domain-containing protein [Tepidibacter formicigenes]SHJ84497.1 Methyltransferase domain-containing protein [Tepidibacter formicigenes DSM 15518]
MERICLERSYYIKGSISPSKKENNIHNFLDTINCSIGEKVLLLGDISNYGKYLKKLGVDVIILENEKYCTTSAILNNENCNIIKGSVQYMPFKDKYFDKVIFLNYFNCFENEEKVLKEVYRVLKYKGNVIIEDKNPKNLITKFKVFQNKIRGYNSKFYHPEEVLDIFDKNGFRGSFKEIDKERYIYIGIKID